MPMLLSVFPAIIRVTGKQERTARWLYLKTSRVMGNVVGVNTCGHLPHMADIMLVSVFSLLSHSCLCSLCSELVQCVTIEDHLCQTLLIDLYLKGPVPPWFGWVL